MSNEKIKEDVTECAFSLASVIQEAGGSLSRRILDMSVREFIATVAGQNHIRFVYSPPIDSPIPAKEKALEASLTKNDEWN